MVLKSSKNLGKNLESYVYKRCDSSVIIIHVLDLLQKKIYFYQSICNELALYCSIYHSSSLSCFMGNCFSLLACSIKRFFLTQVFLVIKLGTGVCIKCITVYDIHRGHDTLILAYYAKWYAASWWALLLPPELCWPKSHMLLNVFASKSKSDQYSEACGCRGIPEGISSALNPLYFPSACATHMSSHRLNMSFFA